VVEHLPRKAKAKFKSQYWGKKTIEDKQITHPRHPDTHKHTHFWFVDITFFSKNITP
jgi:hypothetical protein